MASLMAVTVMMTIRGTELSPGLTPPKMGKIYNSDSVNSRRSAWAGCTPVARRPRGGASATYNQDDEEEEEDVCNVVELEPEVLWDE